MIAARLLAGGAGLVLLRRQRGAQTGLQRGLSLLQASVAVLVFHLLRCAGRHHDRPGSADWLATYAAMVIADVVAAVLLTAVIALHDDPGEWRRLPAALHERLDGRGDHRDRAGRLSPRCRPGGRSRWLCGDRGGAVPGLPGVRPLGSGNAEVEQLYAFTRALDGQRAVDG